MVAGKEGTERDWTEGTGQSASGLPCSPGERPLAKDQGRERGNVPKSALQAARLACDR